MRSTIRQSTWYQTRTGYLVPQMGMEQKAKDTNRENLGQGTTGAHGTKLVKQKEGIKRRIMGL